MQSCWGIVPKILPVTWNQGFHVDDNNDPALKNVKNIPKANDTLETDTGLSHVDPMVNDGFKQPPSFRDGFDI
jgi:hypothetical protein